MPKSRSWRTYQEPTKVIARCTKCGDDFVWLPPRFDMTHFYRVSDHKLCGGKIEMLLDAAVPEAEGAQ
jgi:hypothetical protein